MSASIWNTCVMKVLVRLLLVLLLMLSLASGWLWWQARHPTVRVQQMVADSGPVSSSLHLTGVVRAERTLILAPAVEGRVRKGLPSVGEQVVAGQLVVQLDATEAEAVLHVRQFQAEDASHQLHLSQTQLARHRQKLADGTGNRQEIRDAQDALQGAHIRLRQAEAAVEPARLRVQKHRLLAPMVGVITARRAEVGEFVAAGQAVLELSSVEREILVKADPVEAASLRVGLPARVSLEGSSLPPVPERILRIEPAVQREGNAEHLPVWVSARHPNLLLLLNQQVDVSFETAARQVAVRVPLEALVSREGGNYVWKVREGYLQLQAVQLGVLGDQQVEIRSGLKAGEAVVLPGAQALQEGMAVQVRTESPAAADGDPFSLSQSSTP